MPGSVASASPLVVMPLSLSQSFERESDWHNWTNDYQNGEQQRRTVVTNARRRWRLSKALTTAQLSALRTFYEARKGPQGVFYFYDGLETSPKWGWDATGVSVVGRYAVRFENETWAQEMNTPRHSTEIVLVEVQ